MFSNRLCLIPEKLKEYTIHDRLTKNVKKYMKTLIIFKYYLTKKYYIFIYLNV